MATWLIVYLGITGILTLVYWWMCFISITFGSTREELSLFPIDIRDADYSIAPGVDGIWCYVVSIIGLILLPIPWVLSALGFCIDRIISNRW